MSTGADTTKTVLITGCSSGIGRALAEGLRARGYRVLASARRHTDVERLTADGFEAVQLDLAASGSIREAVAEVRQRVKGRLSGLINNGAYGQPGAVEDLSRDVLRQQFETNVFGTHELTIYFLPMMRNAGGGRIIQISSILGLVCLPYRGAYNASKYALEALTDTMRLELRGSGIHLALIEPGPIESRFRANAHRMFREHIATESSVHRGLYRAVEQRLQNPGPARFSLPPEAVLAKVIHALESPRPRLRYRVTWSAHVMAALKRSLPDRWTDGLIGHFLQT